MAIAEVSRSNGALHLKLQGENLDRWMSMSTVGRAHRWTSSMAGPTLRCRKSSARGRFEWTVSPLESLWQAEHNSWGSEASRPDYYWVNGADWRPEEEQEPRPQTLKALWEDELVQEAGTHSILDIFRVAGPEDTPDYNTVELRRPIGRVNYGGRTSCPVRTSRISTSSPGRAGSADARCSINSHGRTRTALHPSVGAEQ